MGEIEARPENAFELAMDGRCGQGTLHQPGSKTCNISSNVAGTGRHWQALAGTGRHWQALAGTGWHWQHRDATPNTRRMLAAKYLQVCIVFQHPLNRGYNIIILFRQCTRPSWR